MRIPPLRSIAVTAVTTVTDSVAQVDRGGHRRGRQLQRSGLRLPQVRVIVVAVCGGRDT